MKKVLLMVLILSFIIVSPCMANDSQRKVSSGRKTASASITTVSSILYDIEIIATVNGGYASVYDTSGSLVAGTHLVEIREATAFNSKHVNLGEFGIKAYNGIYLFLNDATAILHYR